MQLPRRRGRISHKYPLPGMEVGDHFEVRCSEDEYEVVSNRVRASVWVWGKRHGKRFASRKIEGGIGIWRVA